MPVVDVAGLILGLLLLLYVQDGVTKERKLGLLWHLTPSDIDAPVVVELLPLLLIPSVTGPVASGTVAVVNIVVGCTGVLMEVVLPIEEAWEGLRGPISTSTPFSTTLSLTTSIFPAQ